MSTTASQTTRPVTARDVLAAARERRRIADAAETDLVELAVAWVVAHPADAINEPATYVLRGFGQTDLELAGPGTPSIAEYAVAEFAAAVGLSTEAGKRFLGEALEVTCRLPRLWALVRAGKVPAWKARLVARDTMHLSREAASFVDHHVAGTAARIKPAQLDRTIAAAVARFMPDEAERARRAAADRRHVTVHDRQISFEGTMFVEAELDLADALDFADAVAAGAEARKELGSGESLDVRRAQAVGDLARRQLALDLAADSAEPPPPSRRAVRRPRRLVVYVHLSEAALVGADPVARVERGDVLVTVEQVRQWCGAPEAHVNVKPVLDLTACCEADSDTVPDRLAEQVAVRDRTCVFPWCTRPARRCDCDHTIPRGRAGPTCPCNLAPLCRHHHRLKTHSPWRYTTVEPGTYLWTSPHGYRFLRDPVGTSDISPDISPDISGDVCAVLSRPPDP